MKNFLEKACDRCKPICQTSAAYHKTGEICASANLDGIYQILIENTGRFVESHAADLLITLPHVEEQIADIDSEKDIIYFGLRTRGVDHENYILQRLMENYKDAAYVEYYYRKIFAVVITKQQNENYVDVTIDLLDIKSEINSIDIVNDVYESKKEEHTCQNQ